MKIEIVDRLAPFSHRPGSEVMIPGTFFKAQVFPCALKVVCLKTGESRFLSWNAEGPVFPFTVEQDLDKRVLYIYGQAKQGYFRFVLSQKEEEIVLRVEKAPKEGITVDSQVLYKTDEVAILKAFSPQTSLIKERLFLGSNKKKEWDRIRERRDLFSVLPLWHALGQITPDQGKEEGPLFDLLLQCKKKIQSRERDVDTLLLDVYLAGFSSGLVPRSYDEEFQGILPIHLEKNSLPGPLLSKGSSLIRSLFFQEEKGVYFILPCLPSLFVSGKMMHIHTQQGCHIHIEWTKHKIRTMIVFAEKDSVIQWNFPSEIQRYRIRTNLREKGSMVDRDEPVQVSAGTRLYLDRFQK